MPADGIARLRAGLAAARAVATAVLSRARPEPAARPAAVAPPRRFMHPGSVQVSVPAGAGRVFALLVDPARMPQWFLPHRGWIDGRPAEFAPGVRFRQRITLMGVPSEVRWTVTGVVPERAVWFEGTAPMGIAVGFYLGVTPAGDGSVVRFDGGVEGGSADGPMGAIVARNLVEAMRKSLGRVGRVVAADASPGAPSGRGAGAPVGTSRPAVTRAPGPKPAPIPFRRTGARIDAWTPVIVGAGQVCDRSTGAEGGDPVSLAVRALRLAADDSRNRGILEQADLVGYVASVSWQYPDGAALIASELGAAASTVQTTVFGGDGSLRLLNDVAATIASGHAAIALVGGAEAASTAAAAERAGQTLDWPVQPDGTEPDRTVGTDTLAGNAPETAAGLVAPVHFYALIESAIGARLGLDPAAHQQRITRLWAGFSAVAARNRYAWHRAEHTAEELAAPAAANRMISTPYPKLLTANFQVNQSTGIIVCSAAAATEAGIDQDRWIFLHAGAHATDEWHVTERADLTSSPAIRAVGDAVLGHSGVTVDDVEHIDLYACFPSAVQIAARELGLPIDDPDRPLTVTGGLTFAGGPGNNYASHAVVNLVSLLRSEPDSFGLATAVGWYLTKHAATVLSARPPRREFRDIDADLRLSRPPARRALQVWTGPAVVEACTVCHRRDGTPEASIVTVITPDGDRVVLRAPAVPEIASMVGRRVDVTGSTFIGVSGAERAEV